MRRGYVNVQTPLAPESFATVLTVHLGVKYLEHRQNGIFSIQYSVCIRLYLFVDSLLSFVHGSHVFCHVALAREHFLAVRARNALYTAVLCLSHMNMPKSVCCLHPSPMFLFQYTFPNLIWELRLAFVEKMRTHRWHLVKLIGKER